MTTSNETLPSVAPEPHHPPLVRSMTSLAVAVQRSVIREGIQAG